MLNEVVHGLLLTAETMDLVTEPASLEPHPTTPLHGLLSIDASELAPLAAPDFSQQSDFAGPSRRVQPHRTRKAGFGSVEVDNLIIEAIERDGKPRALACFPQPNICLALVSSWNDVCL